MKKVYILGAGTSKADGLPMQGELIKNIFSLNFVRNREGQNFMDVELCNYSEDIMVAFDRFCEQREKLGLFLLRCFGTEAQCRFAKSIDYSWNESDYNETILHNNMINNAFLQVMHLDISLENVFTILDLNIAAARFFREYSTEELEEIRHALVQCIIYVLSCQMEESATYINSKKMSNHIVKERLSVLPEDDNLTVITLNWDSIFDQELMEICTEHNISGDRKIFPDLCFYDNTFRGGENRKPSTLIKALGHYNIKLLKLHGSINWLYCPKCERMYVDYKQNIALKELGAGELDEQYCRKCKEKVMGKNAPKLHSLIITPTYIKRLENHYLQAIWHNAYIDLSEASEVIFIGYSLPDADYELKNLLKRAIPGNARITVVLRQEDDPEYYRKLLQKEIADESTINQIIQKIDLPYRRYLNLFCSNDIIFRYDGVETYFEEEEYV